MLVGLANHAGPDGAGAFPSVAGGYGPGANRSPAAVLIRPGQPGSGDLLGREVGDVRQVKEGGGQAGAGPHAGGS